MSRIRVSSPAVISRLVSLRRCRNKPSHVRLKVQPSRYVAVKMANLLTAVPGYTPPPPTGTARRLLPLADIFVGALVSRPRSGTLANTWVTPATMLLAAASVLAALVVMAGLLSGLGQWPGLLIGLGLLPCGGFGTGAFAVLAVGVDQRRRHR